MKVALTALAESLTSMDSMKAGLTPMDECMMSMANTKERLKSNESEKGRLKLSVDRDDLTITKNRIYLTLH
ncbi:MAG: hypothetical protein JRJ27_20235 [Deltaproteobacteria bacterium]|nr:hypothetical protein [Deltaproteobacteria bacterium]